MAAVLLLMLPAPARAQVHNVQTLYASQGLCVTGFGSLSTFTEWGIPVAIYSTVEASTYSSCPATRKIVEWVPCPPIPGSYNGECPIYQSWPAKLMPPGSLAIAQDLYLDVNGSKQFCMHLSPSWVYNTTSVSSASMSSSAGAACGQGSYAVYIGAYAMDANNQWQGGWFWNGDVFVL
jgi:hypothetical protein